MEHPRNSSPEADAGNQATPREERVQELVRETRRSILEGNAESALALFNRLHPVDQGEVLLELATEPRQELLAALSPTEAAEILDHIEPEQAVEVFQGVETPTLSHILDEASPDVAADILKQLPQERYQEALETMEESEEVVRLLQYPDDTAGGLMTPESPSVRESITTAIALDQLRILGPDAEDLSDLFVVDDRRRLVGSLSITRLALARPATVVGDITDRDITSVSAGTDQEGCARLMERYNLNQLPVVDEDGRLIGVILAEDMVDVVEEEATEDMFRIAGVGEERAFGPIRNSLMSRLPWLSLNLATAFLAASVIGFFESTIERVVALAIFLPVVAGQGGIGGTQTLTLVIRSMALGEVPGRLGLRLLGREIALALIHGVLLGVVVGLIAYAWKGKPMLGLVLGLAMLGNMVIAGLAGAGIPLLLRRLRMDPAVSAAVFVTTFTDVLGFLLFLGLAAALIEFLL